MIHLRRYFAALTIVLLLYGGYAYAVVPLITPPPLGPRPGPPTTQPVPEAASDRVDFARLFPPGSWELDKPKVVETEQAILLIRDYKPTPDGKLELNPCTLIFFAAATPAKPGEPPSERPIVLQAPAGAMLQFDRPLNIAKAQFGQLIGGRLEGEITIRSPETVAGANDALLITTRNVQLDRTRVFTPHDVEFTYGNSFGRGRDLTIALLPEDPEAPAGTTGIGGVQSLTLAKLERLHIETAGAGIMPAEGTSPISSKVGGNAPIEVTCRGPFLFDVATQIAMFDEAVQVQRLNPLGPPDLLQGDRLLLYFAAQAAAAERGSPVPEVERAPRSRSEQTTGEQTAGHSADRRYGQPGHAVGAVVGHHGCGGQNRLLARKPPAGARAQRGDPAGLAAARAGRVSGPRAGIRNGREGPPGPVVGRRAGATDDGPGPRRRKANARRPLEERAADSPARWQPGDFALGNGFDYGRSAGAIRR